MLAVGDQVEVVGELYGAGQLLQDVDAEALAAQFCVRLGVTHNAERQERESGRQCMCHSCAVSLTTVFPSPRCSGLLSCHGYG